MNSFESNKILLNQQRQPLDLIAQDQLQNVYAPGRIGQLLRQLGESLLNYLTRGNAPRISQVQRGGALVWKVYDPNNHCTHYFNAEEDVRIWLERRFYL